MVYPCDLQIVDGQLPPNYIKLDVDVTEKDLEEEDDEKECEYLFDNDEISNNHPVLKDFNQDEEQAALPKGEKWMISKVEEGRLNYIHISQAIWLLLPRECIARCHQKRHWASKYLPGKEPLTPIMTYLFLATLL